MFGSKRAELSKCVLCGHFQADAWVCDDCAMDYAVHRHDDQRAPTWTAIGKIRNHSDGQATAYQQYMLGASFTRLSSFDADRMMTRLVHGANPGDIVSSRIRTCWRIYCAIAPLIVLKARYGIEQPVRV